MEFVQCLLLFSDFVIYLVFVCLFVFLVWSVGSDYLHVYMHVRKCAVAGVCIYIRSLHINLNTFLNHFHFFHTCFVTVGGDKASKSWFPPAVK